MVGYDKTLCHSTYTEMNILVGYDGSEAAKNALRLAQKHATGLNTALHVVTAVTRQNPLSYDQIVQAEEKLIREVEKALQGSNRLAHRSFLKVSDMSAGEQLVRYAKEYHSCEILLGIRKISRLGKLFSGTTAQHVILNASCPVITVK